MANREYKDSLFRFLFNNSTNLASLYRALDPDTDVRAEDIQIQTLDSILMDRQKNDISFLIPSRYIVLMEHQSTWGPNIPIRCLWYVSDLYRHVIPNKYAMYSTRQIPIVAPWFFVLYIGDILKPKVHTFRLSDSFLCPSDRLELKVTVYNITYDPNCPLLQGCPILHDYSYFIHRIETNRTIQGMTLDQAIRETMVYCKGHNILSDFIKDYQEEVLNMVTLWYDEKEAEEFRREEAERERKEAVKEAVKEATVNAETRMAHLMSLLLEQGKQDELRLAISDAGVRNKLYSQYGI